MGTFGARGSAASGIWRLCRPEAYRVFNGLSAHDQVRGAVWLDSKHGRGELTGVSHVHGEGVGADIANNKPVADGGHDELAVARDNVAGKA